MNNTFGNYTGYVTLTFSFLTLFLSKAGINISYILLIFFTLYCYFLHNPIRPPEYHLRKITNLGMLLYGLGIIAMLFSSSILQDTAWFARKGAFLLLLTPLFYLIIKHTNTAFISLLTGATIAIGYSMTQYGFWSFQERISSYWDIGRWSELLSYLIAFLLPIAHASKERCHNLSTALHTWLILIIIFSIAALISSGSRGPILFLAITISIYLIFTNIKYFIYFIAIASIGIFLINASDEYHTVYERLASIFSQSNNSNNARWLMYENGINFIKYNFENDFVTFLLGTGSHNIASLQIEYLTMPSIESMQESVGHQLSLTDFHNAYIDNYVKMGAIFSTGYLAFIVYLFLFFIQRAKSGSKYAWSGINLILVYQGIGTVYSNSLEFQTSVFFFILSIALVWCTKEESTNLTSKYNESK